VFLHFFFTLSILLLTNQTNAQWYDVEKANKKAVAIHEQAYEKAKKRKYDEAIQKINEAISIDAKYVDAYLSRAGVYADLKNYANSVNDFEKAFALDSVYTKYYKLPYSISLAALGKFDNSLTAINSFLQIPNLNEQSIKAATYRKSTYEFAIEMQKQNKNNNYIFTPVNLGDSINTKEFEYFPSLTIDGKKMIFTRMQNEDEDFYESNFINNKWSKAKPLAGKVNTNLNEGAQNISQDGELLVFTGCNYPEGEGSCDLYYSLKTKNGWSEPLNMGRSINTEFWESTPSISPDKAIIYFTSNRPGGFGGKDIWAAFLLPNGKYGNVQNLGEAVNTSGDETCPFIHADNENLFFSSTGHTGYGMGDLFVSKRVTDSTWQIAKNLGYPINTIHDEAALIVASNGSTAYYSSDANNNSKGGIDIYNFELRDDIKATKTLWVKGKVFDKKTLQGLPSTVELFEISSKRLLNKIRTDENGNYLVTLPIGKEYIFNVSRKGYLFFSDNFSLTTLTDSIATKDIPLLPITAGANIVLKNIFFDTKQFALKTTSLIELDKVVQLLNENPKLKIQISGHTDNVGKPKENLLLSNNRVKSVINYLISKGIVATRLVGKGFGSTKPIANNTTELGKAQNRRTELTVLSN
jgi:outer membrane protein OmpA-like peptidoglycan-associated protein/tetratricopeptide (TPR) repeat protein